MGSPYFFLYVCMYVCIFLRGVCGGGGGAQLRIWSLMGGGRLIYESPTAEGLFRGEVWTHLLFGENLFTITEQFRLLRMATKNLIAFFRRDIEKRP